MSADAVRLTLAPVKALDSGKIVSAEEAASLIRDGDTVATGGFVGIGFAEEIAMAIETLYPREGESDGSCHQQAAQSHAGLRRRSG